MKLSHPAPGQRITSAYGWRTHPISKNRRHHNGTDFGGRFNVLAAADGIVIRKGANMDTSRGFGHSLTIKHENNVTTLYAHGAAASKFNIGDKVKTGDIIFVSGKTGAATGDHLHFEVQINNQYVNPEKYINKDIAPPKPSTPNQLPLVVVDGVLNRGTWRRVQTWLKKEWGYSGKIDGIPGRLTNSALQTFLKTHWGYKGRVDGVLGKISWTSAQTWLKAEYGYSGRIDGIPGRLTYSAFQRFANSINNDGTLNK
jgi:peptidoglycan hydrolase-like protein with peptidoglycan-binding domain